jgi:hypothetical protein
MPRLNVFRMKRTVSRKRRTMPIARLKKMPTESVTKAIKTLLMLSVSKTRLMPKLLGNSRKSKIGFASRRRLTDSSKKPWTKKRPCLNRLEMSLPQLRN